MDIQQSCPEGNAKFSPSRGNLGEKNVLGSAIFGLSESLHTIQSFHSGGKHGATSGI